MISGMIDETVLCARGMARAREFYKKNGSGSGAARLKNNGSWRRTTGITVAIEPFLDAAERRAGLKRLARWIEQKISRKDAKAQRTERTERKEVSLTGEWQAGPEGWSRVVEEGMSVEGMCAELGITRNRLTMLTKEYCGLAVGELVDGVKIRSLKAAFEARLRQAAEGLWGTPGTFVWRKLERTENLPQRRRGAENGGGKNSKYFRMRAEDFFNESRAEERERRVGELCARLRAGFELESWAVRMGFASGAKLKRTCLNVMGLTLRELEKTLAAEVVQYYLCAEDKQLRELACRNDSSLITLRARELYHGCEDAPREPFLDEWSKYEELAAEWLSRMRGMFG